MAEPGRWAQWASRARSATPRSTGQGTPAAQVPDGPADPPAAARPAVLARTAADRKNATARHLQAAITTPPGEIIEGTAGTLRRAVAPKANGRHVWAEDTATGKRRNLSYEEEEAFWAFAVIEVLRLTGIRCEELLELTHHGITEYRLPPRPASSSRCCRSPRARPIRRGCSWSAPSWPTSCRRSSAGSGVPAAMSR